MKTFQRSAVAAPSYWSTSLEGPCHGPRSSVLVATALDEPSAIALRRGAELARLLDAELIVLHVVAPEGWFSVLFPGTRSSDAASVQQRVTASAKAARVWAASVLGHGVVPRLIVQCGAVATSILEVAAVARTSVLVLGDKPRSSSWLSRSSGIVRAVIRDAALPVLVARPERPGRQIVAATNFADGRYPALCQAARLGARLGAHVTFVHNADRSEYTAAASVLGIAVPAVVSPLEPDVDRRRLELEEVAHFIGSDIDTVITAKSRTPDAILDVARDRDADLVVVGRRRRTTLADRASLGTAATVARTARRSVLSIPIREGALSGWAA